MYDIQIYLKQKRALQKGNLFFQVPGGNSCVSRAMLIVASLSMLCGDVIIMLSLEAPNTYMLVGGLKLSERYESQLGRIIPYIMENKTCLKPPTSMQPPHFMMIQSPFFHLQVVVHPFTLQRWQIALVVWSPHIYQGFTLMVHAVLFDGFLRNVWITRQHTNKLAVEHVILLLFAESRLMQPCISYIPTKNHGKTWVSLVYSWFSWLNCQASWAITPLLWW